MTSTFSPSHYPKDLAEAVYSELQQWGIDYLAIELLIYLFDVMYSASLKTEEGNPIVFHIVYLDPTNPDPKPPKRIVQDRWSYVPLSEPIPLTISNIVKLARASDPRTSSLAIYPNNQNYMFIWGIVDQGNQHYAFLNYESDDGPEPPGVFQASIIAIGHIAVYFHFEKIAELKANLLLPKALDVFSKGPVIEKVWPGIMSYVDLVRQEIPEEVYKERSHWNASLVAYWLSALCRLLLRTQSFRHGGAILITSEQNHRELNIKYRIEYDRLCSALQSYAILTIKHTSTDDYIHMDFVEDDADIPVELYLDVIVDKAEIEDVRSEIDGTLWFISSLNRVDGLVLLDQSLKVKGFGVEITTPEEPSDVFLATDCFARKSRLRKIDYNQYGTRHRSMMRYCAKYPNSVGFVISHDGDIRVMTQVKGMLVMWDNIKLNREFKRRKRKRKSS